MPKESGDEERDGELNEDYDFQFELMAEVPVAFGTVSMVEERIFCLLSAGWRVGGVTNSVVVPVEFVVGLSFVIGEASSFCGFDDEEVEYNNK